MPETEPRVDHRPALPPARAAPAAQLDRPDRAHPLGARRPGDRVAALHRQAMAAGRVTQSAAGGTASGRWSTAAGRAPARPIALAVRCADRRLPDPFGLRACAARRRRQRLAAFPAIAFRGRHGRDARRDRRLAARRDARVAHDRARRARRPGRGRSAQAVLGPGYAGGSALVATHAAATRALAKVEPQPPEGVHLPAPSPWPFFAPIAFAVMLLGLIFSPFLLLTGIVLGVIAAAGWLLEAGREWRSTDAYGHAIPATRDPAKVWPRQLVPVFAVVIAHRLPRNAGAHRPRLPQRPHSAIGRAHGRRRAGGARDQRELGRVVRHGHAGRSRRDVRST